MKKSKKKQKITINDIANELNISLSTVSRSLNNNKRISQKTRNLVWETAKKMKYQPNIPGIFVKTNANKNVGVIVPDINKSIYINAIKGIQELAYQNGYNVIISDTQESNKKEEAVINNFAKLNLVGIIISLTSGYRKPESLKNLINSGIPLVNFGNVNFEIPIPKSVIDAYQGAVKAVNHLISTGREHIAILTKKGNNYLCDELIKGYRATLNFKGIKYKDSYIIKSDLTQEDIEMAIDLLMDLQIPPDSIIVHDNFTALITLNYLKKNGIKVPDDISVVSFGSEPFNDLLFPAVTSIVYSGYDMGKSAFEQFLKLIHQNNIDSIQKAKTVIQPVSLVIKGTSLKH